jgi:hypothetical protein
MGAPGFEPGSEAPEASILAKLDYALQLNVVFIKTVSLR